MLYVFILVILGSFTPTDVVVQIPLFAFLFPALPTSSLVSFTHRALLFSTALFLLLIFVLLVSLVFSAHKPSLPAIVAHVLLRPALGACHARGDLLAHLEREQIAQGEVGPSRVMRGRRCGEEVMGGGGVEVGG